MRSYLCLLASLVCAFAQSASLTLKKETPVYDRPTSGAKVLMRLKAGKVIQISDEERDGYVQLATKSGRALWIKHSLEAESLEDDIVSSEGGKSSFKRLTIDFGASTGTTSGVSFFEANVGLNWFLQEWLIWRNALFYRTGSGATQSLVGLDTSFRATKNIDPIQVHGGLGYRIATQSVHAPFGEAGLMFSAGGVQIGANVKYILLSATQTGASDQLIYSLIFSGSGVIF